MARNQAAPKGKDLKTNELIKYTEEADSFLSERSHSLDELSVMEELLSGVLTGVRNDIKAGLPAEKIMEKYAALAAARVVTVALTDIDSGKALAASKDILDRTQGKAKEKKEITHRLEKVEEKQLDAILLTEFENLSIEESDED